MSTIEDLQFVNKFAKCWEHWFAALATSKAVCH